MLIFDFNKIGNKLHFYRKQAGMTQSEVAEMAGLCDRTYADIERGTVNMRVETVLHICQALHITPNEILTSSDEDPSIYEEDVAAQFRACSPKERNTILRLAHVFLQSLSD